jgi:glycosyltransferase involved in cell wall biosynthesis
MPEGPRAPFLSVVIPAYNEAQRIRDSLLGAAAWLSAARLPGAAEIVVVDDGSRDETVAVVEATARALPPGSPSLRILRNGRNFGKGYSIKHGVLLAEGEFLLLSDADFSTPIDELPRLLAPVMSGECAIAIGSRGLPESRVEVAQPFWRQTMGRVFNGIVRTATGLPYRDTQCGFKVMRRDAVVPLFRAARIERFAYDVEILYLARKARLEVREIPVLWRDAAGSKVRAARDSLRMLREVAEVLWRDKRSRYGRLGPDA